MATYAFRRSGKHGRAIDHAFAEELVAKYGNRISSMALFDRARGESTLVVQFTNRGAGIGSLYSRGVMYSASWGCISTWIKEAMHDLDTAIYIRKGVFVTRIGTRCESEVCNIGRLLGMRGRSLWKKFPPFDGACWFEACWASSWRTVGAIKAQAAICRAKAWGAWVVDVLQIMTL